MGGKVAPMVGKRFGALVVLRRAPRTHRQADWVCRCDCGNECVKRGMRLRQNRVKTCGQNGCVWWNFAPPTVSKSPTYKSWEHMLRRCREPKYKNYHGRGIVVCERWHKFENFLADMGPRPSRKFSIDRYPDNNGNYEPGNCRWATVSEQSLNRRNTVWVEYAGERIKLFDLLERIGVKKSVVYSRLNLGWALEDALFRPVRPKKTRLAAHRQQW